MNGALAMLESTGLSEKSPDQADFIATARSGTEAMTAFVEDLKVAAGKTDPGLIDQIKIEPKPVDLIQVCDEGGGGFRVADQCGTVL
jgi:hypothetical protein